MEADLIEEICQADKTREDIGAMLYRIGTVIGRPPAATTEHSATVPRTRCNAKLPKLTLRKFTSLNGKLFGTPMRRLYIATQTYQT